MRKRFTKILATIGPSSASIDKLQLLHEVGVDAFRLNFSHGSHDDHARAIKAIRKIELDSETPIAIIADMQGPKIRCGEFENGQIELNYGEQIFIEYSKEPGYEGLIRMPHPELFKALEAGHILKFDDGKLQVTITANDGVRLCARVDTPGTLKSKKGINVINAVLPMSAMTVKDKIDMRFALSQNVDFIALSFVQSAQDVKEARGIIDDRAGIIVKIEKPSAVDNLAEILEESDVVMVARGDLGVELPLEQVPIVQRRIIKEARDQGKPVIVATHMLESMIDAPAPTRAEASDVATAIFQGADVVMLSAETAVGQYPDTAVATMDRIIKAAESDPNYWSAFSLGVLVSASTAEDAISFSAKSIAQTMNCAAVFGITQTGSTVKRISRQRPPCPVIGLTPLINIARRMVLYWGVVPFVTSDPKSFDEMVASLQSVATSKLEFPKGSSVLITAGIPFGRPGTTNTLKVAVLGE